jgi:hypothetical protein
MDAGRQRNDESRHLINSTGNWQEKELAQCFCLFVYLLLLLFFNK